MNPPPTDSEMLVAALADTSRSASPSEEPEPEELLDYLADRLSPEDEERVGRLLAASPEAAGILLDLADLEAASAGAGQRPSELAVHVHWQDLKERLPAIAIAPSTRRRSPLLSSVAALLLVSTVSLSVRVWQLQGELNRPVANFPTLELPSVRRAGGEPAIGLSPGARFRLVLDPEIRCPTYTAKIEGPGGSHSQTIEGLERDDRGRLALSLRGWPGEYRLSLSGCEPRRELEEHPFRISARAG